MLSPFKHLKRAAVCVGAGRGGCRSISISIQGENSLSDTGDAERDLIMWTLWAIKIFYFILEAKGKFFFWVTMWSGAVT